MATLAVFHRQPTTTTAVDLKRAKHQSKGDEEVYFAGGGKIRLLNSLISPLDSKKLEPSLVNREKNFLHLFVSTEEPSDNKEFFSSSKLSKYPWNELAEISPPVSVPGLSKFYVATVKLDENNKHSLIGWQAFETYFDFSRPSVYWLSENQFYPPVAGTGLDVSFGIEALDAKEDQTSFVLEYSLDNKKWTEIPDASFSASTKPSEWVASFKYAFSDEHPMRVRLRGKDYAQNAFESSPSPNLIGRAGVVSSATDTERARCPEKSALVAQLASSYVCLPKNNQSFRRAYFSFFNSGKQALLFSDTSDNRLGYKLNLKSAESSNDVFSAFLASDSALFSSASLLEKNAIRFVDFSEDQMRYEEVLVVFDVLSPAIPNGLSSNNACYSSDPDSRPKVLVKGNTQGLKISPFECFR